ncbi:hypothetical protein BGX28_000394, partial [Mortierella sp. GBA30]
MDAFSLTPNGKLDRQALPAPGAGDFARQTYEAPKGELEVALANIWADLLSIEQVSRHDNFFALGGHSLLAVQMISRLNRLGHSLSVRAVFESSTLSVLAHSVGQRHDVVVPTNLITHDTTRITPDMLPLIDLRQTDIDHIVERVPGGTANIQDIYALSPLQDGILFHHLMADIGDPYMLFISMQFDTRAFLDQYLASMKRVVDRHDILRTGFYWQGLSASAQVVWREAPLSITEFRVDADAGSVAEQLEQMFNHENYRMDLTQAPLLRCVIAQNRDGSWILLKIIHHLISDHSTSKIILSEIQALCTGKSDTLPPVQPYRNLIAQVQLGISREEHERFFIEMLADIDTPSLPFDLTNVHCDGSLITESRCKLPQELDTRLRSQASRLGVNLASLCHVAWAQVVARTSGQQHVVFGTVLLGRMNALANFDGATGPFISTLPIRVDLDEGSVEESVRATNGNLAALFEHERASLVLAQRCSSIAAGAPLFSTLLNYRHGSTSNNDPADYGMKRLEVRQRTNYPIRMTVIDYGTSLGLSGQVVQPLDAARMCSYMLEALESLSMALERRPSMPVAKLEILPMGERQLILRKWNATQEAYPDHHCLHHLFENQAELTPDAIAVVHGDRSMTYAELNTRANRLAHRLVAIGVRPDALIAICVERSLAMIIGILGILKAGGAYVPLDPFYPCDRLREVINDAAPSILLADRAGREALGKGTLASLTVVDPNTQEQEESSNPQVIGLSPQHLSYVIYTSGSTGKPKGVMIEHQGVVNLVVFRAKMFQIHPHSRVLQFTSLSFDHSVSEIFSALTSGASLYLIQDDIRFDKQRLWSVMHHCSITHVSFTPSLLQDCNELPALTTLRALVVMGEAVPKTLSATLRRIAPCSNIFNSYGPTETSIATSAWKFLKNFGEDTVSIGQPLPNKTIYLLDTHGNPVPLGAIGEIYIGGIGVARGYLNQPGMTKERFIPDP